MKLLIIKDVDKIKEVDVSEQLIYDVVDYWIKVFKGEIEEEPARTEMYSRVSREVDSEITNILLDDEQKLSKRIRRKLRYFNRLKKNHAKYVLASLAYLNLN